MSAEEQSSEGMNFKAGRDLDIEISGDLVAGDKIMAETYIRQIIVQSAEVRELETEPPAAGESPFKGLQYFTEADADLFFGRSALTTNLVNRLHETRFLAVVGASGSGKSSVVRAGVVPALKNGRRLPDGSLPPTGNWHVS
ncbi:MAG: hypothetical protein KDE51_13840, partial [Anaerolineales bacterium]|nr:hypothetical protein [Anaerolineales bacterium]